MATELFTHLNIIFRPTKHINSQQIFKYLIEVTENGYLWLLNIATPNPVLENSIKPTKNGCLKLLQLYSVHIFRDDKKPSNVHFSFEVLFYSHHISPCLLNGIHLSRIENFIDISLHWHIHMDWKSKIILFEWYSLAAFRILKLSYFQCFCSFKWFHCTMVIDEIEFRIKNKFNVCCFSICWMKIAMFNSIWWR